MSRVHERTNSEVKYRSKVVRVFPSVVSPTRLVGARDVRARRGIVGVALLLGEEDGRALRGQA